MIGQTNCICSGYRPYNFTTVCNVFCFLHEITGNAGSTINQSLFVQL